MTIISRVGGISPSAPGSVVTPTIPNPSTHIQQAAAGTVISGEVMGRNAQGLLQIQTSQGMVEVQTPQQFPPGTQIQLQIQQPGAQVQVQLRALPPATQQTAQMPQQMAEAGLNLQVLAELESNLPTLPLLKMNELIPAKLLYLQAAMPEVITQQRTQLPRQLSQLSGKLLKLDGNSATIETEFGEVSVPFVPPSTARKLQQGQSYVRLNVDQSVQPPQVEIAETMVEKPPVENEPDSPAALKQLQGKKNAEALVKLFQKILPPDAGQKLEAYQQLARPANGSIVQTQVKLVQIAMPGEATPEQLPPQQFTARVIAETGQKHAVLQTPYGLLSLPKGQPLPVGTTIVIQLEDAAITQQLTAKTVTTAAPAYPTRSWPTVDEVLSNLVVNNPDMADELTQHILPNIQGKNFAGQMLLYIAAAYAGDIRNWLGVKTVKMLEEDKLSKIAGKLKEEFAAEHDKMEDTPNSTWRSLNLPVFDGTQLHRAQIQWQNYKDEKDKKDTTRFVVDVALSNLGPMKLDGIVKPLEFNLTVKSEKLLPAKVQHDISTIFTDYVEIVGYKGVIGFRTA